MKQIERMRGLIVSALTFVLLVISIQPASAATEYYSSLSTGCSSNYPGGVSVYSMRYKSTVSAVITSIKVAVGGNSTTGFENTTVLIFSDSATANVPYRILETFTANSVVGSGATTVIKYVGSRTINPGDKFWVAQNSPTTLPTVCYKNLTESSALAMNGIAVDTATSVSTAYRATASVPLRNSSAWNANQGQGYFQISLEGNSAPTESSLTVSLVAGGNQVVFRQQSGASLRANLSADGKVTFYQNEKKIPGCISVSSSSLVATCNWKPNIHGATRISASLKPTDDGIKSSTSLPFALSTISRSNKR